MTILAILLSWTLLLIGSLRWRYWWARLWYRPVKAQVTHSRPRALSQGGDEVSDCWYAPDVRFTYEALDGQRITTLLSSPCLHGTSDEAEAMTRCQDFPEGSHVELWCDPKFPSTVVLHRHFEWCGPVLIAIAALVLGRMWCLETLSSTGLLVVVTSWGVVHSLVCFVFCLLRDTEEMLHAAKDGCQVCDASRWQRFDRRFQATKEAELIELGFSLLGVFYAPSARRTGIADITSLYISDDGLTVAGIGECRYVRRLWGLVSFPFLNTRNVYFYSAWGRGIILKTVCIIDNQTEKAYSTRAARFYRQELQVGTPIGDMLAAHQHRTKRIILEEGLSPSTLDSTARCSELMNTEIRIMCEESTLDAYESQFEEGIPSSLSVV